ncbi:MFS transporter [Algoriphagus sanaruensis]|uniref:Major facilitator superfamily (MFS) profile domain-containing protein n=1 Tax=Algoriphagus sanaruensis TaxID=1727163 RepID=A0A142ES45_9BACT|nr:MFS transporter [Algoriphagus sanaruensis]AMQ57950.1 hypothetical protein AO498_15960 [Algoriphagus sanaruensis]
MTQSINKSALFIGSCFALITTGLSFSIRAGILSQLGTEFELSREQLGHISSMWFYGFPISMIIGGLVYHSVGPKIIMKIAFVAHILGVLLTIFATGYIGLLISMLCIGLGTGCTEAACNPMIADMFSGPKMDKMLNRFHMWFPGGIVMGALISKLMTILNLGWQAQMGVVMIPAITYFVLFFGKKFPEPAVNEATSLKSNLKAMVSPVYLFLIACMALTAISEFGPGQWVEVILGSSGADPMIILALTAGLVTILRFFAGPVVSSLGQTGVLLFGAILTAIGIYLFSILTGPMAYVAAILYGLGYAYFWPVMVGAVAKRVPLSSALGMSVIGAVGMFSSGIFQPIIGKWIDNANEKFSSIYNTKEAIDLATGQETLQKMVLFPGILIVLFVIFFIWQRGVKTTGKTTH